MGKDKSLIGQEIS